MAADPNPAPIELDALEFEFRDVLEDVFPHPLQAAVLPVIVVRDNVFYLQGTAFSIGNNLALTAHHVLTQEDTDIISHAGVLHVVPGDESGMVHATIIEVEDVTAHPGSTDVSVLRLKSPPPGEHNPMPLRPLRLGMAPPPVDETILMLGYTHADPMASIDEVLRLRPKLHLTTGKVVQHTPEGFGRCKGPCWQVEATTVNQMSGGPALAAAGDGTDLMVARGVISTGFNVAEDDVPLSNAAMPYTAMALAPVVNRGTTEEPTYLYELAQNGHIPVVDLDLVDLDFADPAKPRLGLKVEAHEPEAG